VVSPANIRTSACHGSLYSLPIANVNRVGGRPALPAAGKELKEPPALRRQPRCGFGTKHPLIDSPVVFWMWELAMFKKLTDCEPDGFEARCYGYFTRL
jgi:hypothetical protein